MCVCEEGVGGGCGGNGHDTLETKTSICLTLTVAVLSMERSTIVLN